jgi:hypothetical protein
VGIEILTFIGINVGPIEQSDLDGNHDYEEDGCEA